MKKEDKNKNQDMDDLDIDLSKKEEETQIEDPSTSSGQDKDEVFVISKSKANLVKNLLENIKENNEKLTQIFSSIVGIDGEERIGISQKSDEGFSSSELEEDIEGSKIIEGVFDGENMIGPDGKQYTVPANYASKSKLVEGDILKLTITGNGTFVYKQIGPIDRVRIVGIIEQDANGSFFVSSDGRKWRILTASVTYYKGNNEDEAVILVPKNGDSKWAALENVVRNPQ